MTGWKLVEGALCDGVVSGTIVCRPISEGPAVGLGSMWHMCMGGKWYPFGMWGC